MDIFVAFSVIETQVTTYRDGENEEKKKQPPYPTKFHVLALEAFLIDCFCAVGRFLVPKM